MSKERAQRLAASTDPKELEESLRLFRLHLEQFPPDEDTLQAMQSAARRFGLFELAHQQRDLVADCLCRLSLPDQDLFPALARLRDAVARGQEQPCKKRSLTSNAIWKPACAGPGGSPAGPAWPRPPTSTWPATQIFYPD